MHDASAIIETDVPARLDRLPWSRFHSLVIVALGITWILDALGGVVLLQPGLLRPDWGWRAAFGIGAVLGLGILFLRQWIPESPRWLMLHARTEECEAVLCGIEERVLARPGAKPLAEAGARLRLVAASHTPILRMIRAILRDYPRRAVLGLVLMASQAFFYNAIFFSYALVLTRFYSVPSDSIGWYMLPFALGNFMGPLLLGPLFDTP